MQNNIHEQKAAEQKQAQAKALNHRIAIAALVVALVATAALVVGCNNGGDKKPAAKPEVAEAALSADDYKAEVQNVITQYSEAYQMYSSKIASSLGELETDDKLVKKDVAAVKEASEEFSAAAGEAFEKLRDLNAPEEYKEVQAKIKTYAEAMIDVGMPAIIDPLMALKEGQTLGSFSIRANQPSEAQTKRLNKASDEFTEMLKKLDIAVDDAGAGGSSND